MDFLRLLVAANWLILFVGFGVIWRRAQQGRSEARRRTERRSLIGMLLEFTAIGIVFYGWGSQAVLGLAVAIAAAVLAIASTVFGLAASAHLGAQLRIQAVVTDEHRLVTSGAYRIVRHPIYASLFGLLIATGMVSGEPRFLLLAIPVFIAGTEIRIAAEEKLLRQHFGASYEQYRSRVKAYLPGLR